MVVAMIAMVELCARVRSKQETATKEHNFLGMQKKKNFDKKSFFQTLIYAISGDGHDFLTSCSAFLRSG